ncbi:MAG: Rv2175c family DNA-binding protein [Cumulibacter sp.]
MSDLKSTWPSCEWLTYAQVAERLGVEVKTVRQLVRDGGLLGRGGDDPQRIPADLLPGGVISKYLRGVISVLRDGGFSDDEALRWLLEQDESLGGAPAWALHHDLHREVTRRAQAMAF